jgi:hypothetical protein
MAVLTESERLEPMSLQPPPKLRGLHRVLSRRCDYAKICHGSPPTENSCIRATLT